MRPVSTFFDIQLSNSRDLHDEKKENSRDFSVNVIISNFSGENNEKQ